ncbi:hypothetical protein [uncultured Winogradskyella sp.]|uniref:hypothetical protein n=1 Tax=uncultured Winogradskyella sp. TaxID=395353 RepID=UPI00262E7690|nr:hypothetical protein [uncultured Winogradskyella sp.]
MEKGEILRKYKLNIDKTIKSLSIYPKTYKKLKSMDKQWIVCFRVFRPLEDKRKKFVFKRIKINGEMVNLNQEKDHDKRIYIAELLRDTIKYDLLNHERIIIGFMYGTDKAKEIYPHVFEIAPSKESLNFVSIEDAFKEVYDKIKNNNSISLSSKNEYLSKWNGFLHDIGDKKNLHVTEFNRELVENYLNQKGKTVSGTTYNFIRGRLGSMLKELRKLGYIKEDFMDLIDTRKYTNTKNKPFNPKQIKKLSVLLKPDEYMRFYVNHIYCGLMRPTAAALLQVKHIDLENRKFNLEDKTNRGKWNFIRHIVDPLYKVYKELDLSDPEAYIFGRKGFCERWKVSDRRKATIKGEMIRHYIDKVGGDSEHTLKSFRHNGIGNFYKTAYDSNVEKGIPHPQEEALKEIIKYTHHSTTREVMPYLRMVVPELNEDYSKHIKGI